MNHHNRQAGFTIVELLIVIVVIAILAAITTVAYNGIQSRARSSSIASDISQAERALKMYHAENGVYPQTQTTTMSAGATSNQEVYVDNNCTINAVATATKTSAWLPGVTQSLPQSDGNSGGGALVGNGTVYHGGCYVYQSDGTSFILSAWNMLREPQNDIFYSRVGFRETNQNELYYLCNHPNVGGNYGNTYDTAEDYYKHSYTITNINNCNENTSYGA